MNETQTRDLHAILADLADFTVASSGTRAIALYHELEDTLRAQPGQRLEAIRVSLRAGNISYGELAELQALAPYIEPGDTELLEPAGVPENIADELAAEAEHDSRTMAPPVPGVTRNAGYTVRAVIHAHDAERGLLANWSVAGENPETGAWVTWNAYMQDGTRAGKLSYDGGHYFNAVSGPSGLARADNRRRALADLAIRAGTMSDVGLRIAHEITRYHDVTGPYTSGEREDRRMASRLRKWCQG